eukprot:g11549.t1
MDHYIALGENPVASRFINPVRAALGLASVALLSIAGFATNHVLRFANGDSASSSNSFSPAGGIDKVILRPGAPILAIPPPGDGPASVFLWLDSVGVGTAVPRSFSLGAMADDGWVYGAKTQWGDGRHVAIVTGNAGDIIKGKLYNFPSTLLQAKLKTADELHGYDPSKPDQGLLRQRILEVVKQDGSVVKAYGYLAPSKAAPVPVAVGDFDAVRAAIKKILPAKRGKEGGWDDGSLGPLFLRLAWHSSGTYDKSDGSGGSVGATMRFEPESSDPGNAGLHHGREFLMPIKQQFPWISYSDLWILASYVFLEESGGPVLEFVPGRVDAPTTHPVVPPNGRLPDAEKPTRQELFDHIRGLFVKRMGFSERETVALIAGGHVYGRCHTDRSGYAGPWVSNPIKFSNEYCTDLLEDAWKEVTHDSPECRDGMRPVKGNKQWNNKDGKGPQMMLPSDMALIWEPTWKKVIEQYAKDEDLLRREFGHAFKKLTENGFLASTGQPLNPLMKPKSSTSSSAATSTSSSSSVSSSSHSSAGKSTVGDYAAVRQAIHAILPTKRAKQGGWDDGSLGPLFLRLAWHSSGTYDKSDGSGGSCGATMRFKQEASDPANAGLEHGRKFLEPIKAQFPWISYSDLWILASYVFLEESGGPKLEFVPGRKDAPESNPVIPPNGRLPDAEKPTRQELFDHIRGLFVKRMGFSERETVALIAGGHTYGRCHTDRTGYAGPWIGNPIKFSNE